MPNAPGIYFREADQIRLQGMGVATDLKPVPRFDQRRADLLTENDKLRQERDSARRSCAMWAKQNHELMLAMERAERFRTATVLVALGILAVLLSLGIGWWSRA